MTARRGPRALGAVPLLALVLGCVGSNDPPPDARPADVLLVVVDTLRRDFVSAYGAPFPATPAMDALAAEGWVLDAHHATTSQTAPSHASMFTGLLPRLHGLRRNGWVLGEEAPTLAEAFADAGYRTAAVIGASVLDGRFGLGRGFETWDDALDPDETGAVEQRADAVVDRALAALAREDDRPLFLFVHLFDPHTPYHTDDADRGRPAELEPVLGPRLEPSEAYPKPDLLARQTAYGLEVEYADRHLARLFAAWDARPGADASVVALTSDHGEGLGEHAYLGHGFHLYEEQLLVPMILRQRVRGVRDARVSAATSHLDLAATLLDLVDLDPAGLGGASLLPALLGETSPPTGPVLAERRLYHPDETERGREIRRLREAGAGVGDQVAVVDGGWKLIWTEDADEELFELASDPAEARDRLAEAPAPLPGMVGLAEALHARLELAPGGPEPVVDPEVARILDALGY